MNSLNNQRPVIRHVTLSDQLFCRWYFYSPPSGEFPVLPRKKAGKEMTEPRPQSALSCICPFLIGCFPAEPRPLLTRRYIQTTNWRWFLCRFQGFEPQSADCHRQTDSTGPHLAPQSASFPFLINRFISQLARTFNDISLIFFFLATLQAIGQQPTELHRRSGTQME